METPEIYELVAQSVRQLDDAQRKTERDVESVKEQLKALVELLVARGALVEGHRKHLAVVGRSVDEGKRRIRLRSYVDKHTVEPAPPIDCDARFPLCKARCCRLNVELTAQDIEDDHLRFDLAEPYILRKEADGYCTYIDRSTLFCTNYEKRPATCRQFDCRGDKRIWIDFDARIPAPGV